MKMLFQLLQSLLEVESISSEMNGLLIVVKFECLMYFHVIPNYVIYHIQKWSANYHSYNTFWKKLMDKVATMVPSYQTIYAKAQEICEYSVETA